MNHLRGKSIRVLEILFVFMIMLVTCAFTYDGKSENSIYADMSNWSYYEADGDKTADLFIVCPTVDMGKNNNYHADMLDEKYRKSFTGALNMELGIYQDVCNVYAPYYRQVTFPTYSLDDDMQEACIELAYQDVSDAFAYYLEHCDNTRPLILAGFSQGADMDIRLLKEYFADSALAQRLVAVYAIGWRVTEEELNHYPQLKMAEAENDTGVIVTFSSEAEEVTDSLMIPSGEKTYAINPLNWRTDSEVADASLNQGACFTDYSGEITKEIPALTGCYIDPNRGALKVTNVNSQDYPGVIFDDGIYHLYDYQFFYRNLKNNVKVRLEAYQNNNQDFFMP